MSQVFDPGEKLSSKWLVELQVPVAVSLEASHYPQAAHLWEKALRRSPAIEGLSVIEGMRGCGFSLGLLVAPEISLLKFLHLNIDKYMED